MDMESNITEDNFKKTAEFLSAETLVSLRNPKEDQLIPNVGPKYATRDKSWIEDKELDCALNTYQDILSQKRAVRICDLAQATWDEELHIAVAENLKGKFVQHMGHTLDGKITLSPEEAIFLLENGCLEMKYSNGPMSTEEAYAVLLKENFDLVKYHVFSHLSLLGFIVIPHPKPLSRQNRGKLSGMKKQNISVNKQNDRLNFTGVLVTEDASLKPSNPTVTVDVEKCASSSLEKNVVTESLPAKEKCESPCLINNEIIAQHSVESNGIQPCSEEENNEINVNEKILNSNKEEISNINKVSTVNGNSELIANINNESVLNNDHKHGGQYSNEKNEHYLNQDECNKEDNNEYGIKNDNKPTVSEGTEFSMNKNKELSINDDIKSNLKESDQCSLNDINEQAINTVTEQAINTVDKQALNDNSIQEMDTSSCEDEACLEMIGHTPKNDDDSDYLQVSLEEEENLDILTCSSPSRQSFSENESLFVDEEITLLEVTKKKSAPLAVIDLLSDEEGSMQAQGLSESDDEIKIVEVLEKPTQNKENFRSRFNFAKCRSEKIQNCKQERSNQNAHSSVEGSNQNTRSAVPLSQFPFIFRKELVCVPRPLLSFLPLHVQPRKEAYILDFNKKQSDQPSQPPARLWNSFRDMQDYQRARRQHRHLNRSKFFGQDNRPWHSNHRDNNSFPRETWQQPFNNAITPDRFTWNRNRRFDRSASRSSHSDLNFNNDSAPIDQKPFTQMPLLTQPNQLPFPRFPTEQLQFPTTSIIRPPDFGLSAANFAPPGMSHIPNFQTEVQRAAFSYASAMISSMFGSGFNPNSMQNYGGMNGAPNNRLNYFDNQRNRPPRNNPFPCQYRNVNNKRSWTDVSGAEERHSDNSDIEEIPINLNEFLWNVSNISPLVKPGTKHHISEVLKSLQTTQMAQLTNKNKHRNQMCFPDNPTLEIAYDVYLPGTIFKKSSPGVPKFRIIVCRASDHLPRYSEIALLQRRWSDGSLIEIAVVDMSSVSFYSLNSVSLPIAFD